MDGSLGGIIASLFFMALFMAAGLAAAMLLLPKERFLVRAALGGALGLAGMMWLPALFAFFFGFTVIAHLPAMLIAAAALSVMLVLRRQDLVASLRGIKPDMPLIACAVPLLLFCMYILYTHTLLPGVNGALMTGQSTYGDMSMHMGIVTSIARQGSFPPEYSIMPGTKMSYPFLCDSVSASLYLLGAPLSMAYVLPMIPALCLVFAGAWALMRAITGSRVKTVTAFALFFLCGGFGFIYFLDDLKKNPSGFERIFTAFYETPTNYTEGNIRWVNVVVDMLIPQRATLMGWAVLFICLFLLYRAAFCGQRRCYIPLAVLAGALPMIHTHSFLALFVISAAWILCTFKAKDVRWYLLYMGVTAVLALPQLIGWTFGQASAGGFVKLWFNWVNERDNPIWFYVKNIGVPALFFVPALLKLDNKGWRMMSGPLALWALAEMVVFQPNKYDNNKLLLVSFLFICCMVASCMVEAYKRLEPGWARRAGAGIVAFMCVFSALLSMGREWVSEYELFGAPHVQAARFIENNTETDALFLTADHHNNAVSCLTGRSILAGSDSFLYYHGIDSSSRKSDMYEMFSSREALERLGAQYGVDFIYVSDYERYHYAIAGDLFDGLELVYQNDTVEIYRL